MKGFAASSKPYTDQTNPFMEGSTRIADASKTKDVKYHTNQDSPRKAVTQYT